MSRFRTGALKALDRIYGLLEGTAPSTLETGLPVQLVHDTSREAELGAGIGQTTLSPGLFLLSNTHVHPAGGEAIMATMNPRTQITNSVGPSDLPGSFDFDVWLLGAFLYSVTETIIASATAVSFHPFIPGGALGFSKLIANWTGRVSIADAAATGQDDAGVSSALGAEYFPYLLPFGTLLNSRTVAAAAVPGTIFVVFPSWVGPRGARPPGLA